SSRRRHTGLQGDWSSDVCSSDLKFFPWILADLADGVLLVIQAGSTAAQIAERTAAEFQGKNLLGVVLNQVEKRDCWNDYYGGRIVQLETTDRALPAGERLS